MGRGVPARAGRAPGPGRHARVQGHRRAALYIRTLLFADTARYLPETWADIGRQIDENARRTVQPEEQGSARDPATETEWISAGVNDRLHDLADRLRCRLRDEYPELE